ncbi:shikimate 5-dehydrogenase [Hoyosella rhizosphaerae]|uniref:Shikimate 5-dehydrogenase n=2 Tax=Hoyosella rhizosphaerae TaxID=1755582 RepID=A0A916XAD3_9ACTN|nr:shikimate 5-dehydrogenase [Hoyosella rhizosphaerae]
MFMPTRDTIICISLAGKPSNIGTRFHNFLYRKLGMNYLYKACTTEDIVGAVAGVRALGIRGCSVSMPFKEAVIDLVDTLDESARAIGSVNTIVNTDGHLAAYNTDYLAVRSLLRTHEVSTSSRVAVCGSGGMAKATTAALRDSGFSDVTIVARNAHSGGKLADTYRYRWIPETTSAYDVLINATPIGMEHQPGLPFSAETIDAAHTVFDVIAMPATTELLAYARKAGKKTIAGTEVIALQAAEQFALYTGIVPPDDLLREASEFSRR